MTQTFLSGDNLTSSPVVVQQAGIYMEQYATIGNLGYFASNAELRKLQPVGTNFNDFYDLTRRNYDGNLIIGIFQRYIKSYRDKYYESFFVHYNFTQYVATAVSDENVIKAIKEATERVNNILINTDSEKVKALNELKALLAVLEKVFGSYNGTNKTLIKKN